VEVVLPDRPPAEVQPVVVLEFNETPRVTAP
jgi:hypothetical protein